MHGQEQPLFWIQLSQLFHETELLALVPCVLDGAVEVLFLHEDVLDLQGLGEAAAGADRDGPRVSVQQVLAEDCEVVDCEGVGRKVLFDLLLSVLPLVEHAASVVDEHVDLLQGAPELLGRLVHRALLAQLAQDQVDVLVGSLLPDLLRGRLASLLVAAQQVHVGLPRGCLLGGGVADAAVGASDHVVLALESALERRKWLVALGEVEVSLDEELQLPEAVHACYCDKKQTGKRQNGLILIFLQFSGRAYSECWRMRPCCSWLTTGDTQISFWEGKGFDFLEAVLQVGLRWALEDLDVQLAGGVEYPLRVVGKLHVLMEFLVLVLGEATSSSSMQSIRPSASSSSALLNFLRLIRGEILGELTTMLTLLESMALLFFSLHCGQTDWWASSVTCLLSTSPVIFISMRMTKRAGTSALPSSKTQKQSRAQSMQAKLPQASSSVKISKVPTWKSWQRQLKKPLRQSSKQSPGYMSMEQKMKPLRKMNICRKMDMISGKEWRRFLLKLYISFSRSRSGNSKTGSSCRKAQMGAYLGLKRMTRHISSRKRYQFRYLAWMAALYWMSLLKRRWLLLWCRSRMVWQAQMTNRSEAIACSVILNPFNFVDLDALSSQSVSSLALTISRLNSLYSPVSVQLRTNLLSPKLMVSLKTQLSSSQSLRELVQKSLKQLKASSTERKVLELNWFLLSCISKRISGSLLLLNTTSPSSCMLCDTLTILTKCSLISSKVANSISHSSMLRPSSQRPKSSLPSRLRLKQVRRQRSCWWISSLVVKTTATEAMISRLTSISCGELWMPCPLRISSSLPCGGGESSDCLDRLMACGIIESIYCGLVLWIIITKMIARLLRGFSTEKWHHTTILALKRAGETVIIGDGQVSLGSTRVKTDARKIRKMSDGVYCGFAGSLADAFYLIEGLEQVMAKYPKQTLKSCISYAKEWRTGKQHRHLEATLIVIDKETIIELDGTGNVLEIEDVIGIGSGGLYAECAARALLGHTALSGEQIAQAAMQIAASKCIYTSDKFVMEKIV